MIGGDIQLELRKFVAPEYIFGVGSRIMAANYCKKLGGKTLLLVTDQGVMLTSWMDELQKALNEAGLEYVIFSSVSPNPRDYEVMDGLAVYLENKCNLILAIGGGSVMDCAKGIGIVATNHKHICDFEGVDKILHPIPPMVCIPTTGGTSADVSQFAIINNYSKKYKMAIISKAIVPDVALIDPLVLTSMDPFLTACTGIDALSHAIEAFVSNANSAFTDLYAAEAIRLLHHNLLINIEKPQDIQARGKVMLASLYAGLAFSNASLGCVHSLAHSLGGYLDLPHGECNAILLPHVVDFNFEKASGRYRTIAGLMELEISGVSDGMLKQHLITHLIQVKQNMNIPATLKTKGVTSDVVGSLAGKAILDPCNATNPKRPFKKDLEVIIREAM